MVGMHVCGYRGAVKTITCRKLLLRRANGSAVVELDGKVDEVHCESAYVDGVGVGVAVSVAGEEVLDVLLCGGCGVELASLLQCEQDACASEINCSRIA